MPGPQKILIVEDEPLIAMMLEDFLDALDRVVAGMADSVASAVELVEAGGIDAVVMDVNLRGGDLLADRRCAGGARHSVRARHRRGGGHDRGGLSRPPHTLQAVHDGQCREGARQPRRGGLSAGFPLSGRGPAAMSSKLPDSRTRGEELLAQRRCAVAAAGK